MSSSFLSSSRDDTGPGDLAGLFPRNHKAKIFQELGLKLDASTRLHERYLRNPAILAYWKAV